VPLGFHRYLLGKVLGEETKRRFLLRQSFRQEKSRVFHYTSRIDIKSLADKVAVLFVSGSERVARIYEDEIFSTASIL